MSLLALNLLQAAVVTKLKSDAAYMALTEFVYDEVPQAQSYPYTVWDLPSESPEHFMGERANSCRFVLSIFTGDSIAPTSGRSTTAGFKQGLAIATAQIASLKDGTLVVADHTIIDIDVESVDASRDPDGVTRRIDVTWFADLEDAP